MKFCRNCGAELKDNAKFCPKCGATCSTENNPVTPQPAPNPAPQQTPNPTPQPASAASQPAPQPTPAYQPNPAPAPEKKNNKGVLIGVIIACVLVLAGVAVFAVTKLKKDDEAEDEPRVRTEAETRKEIETAAPAETKAATAKAAETEAAAVETTSAAEAASEDFEGYWEGLGGRWGINITKNGDTYQMYYEGSSSAFAGLTATMTGKLQNGILEYQDEVLTSYQYDDSGRKAEIVEHTNGTGSFELTTDESVLMMEGEDVPAIYARSWTGAGENAVSADGVYLLNYAPIVEWNQYASSEYILWYSSDLELSDRDLDFMDADTLKLARNEIYARHGRRFSTPEIQAHFDNCSWYRGTIAPDKFSDNMLSQLEKDNIKKIEAAEQNAPLAGTSLTGGCLLKGLVADDILDWYLSENYYNPYSDHTVADDAYELGDWVGNKLQNATGKMVSISNNIGSTYEWLYGTDIANNITNNFRSYYQHYFTLKDYYTSNGKNSKDEYNALARDCNNWGPGNAQVTLQQLYNDLQLFITESNNEMRKRK